LHPGSGWYKVTARARSEEGRLEDEGTAMSETLEKLRTAVIEGQAVPARDATQAALDEGIAPGRILLEALVPAMDDVGNRYECGEYFVPEMLISVRAMKEGLKLLKPLLVESDVRPAGRVVAGTVKGDLHDIGKNLVGIMLEGAGFEIVDLGCDVPAEKFVAAAREGADLVALSALLSTTMPNIKATIQALDDAGLRERVKVMIGGAPVNDSVAREYGADGYAADASTAVALARSLAGVTA
jgi:5-methyltetrahydrofolate--homocysteine methyltransferase